MNVRPQLCSHTTTPGNTIPGLRLSLTVPDRVNDGASTAIATESETPRVSATTIVMPLPTALTSPAEFTAAIAESLERQVTITPITCPFWSRTSAASWAVSPRIVNVSVSGAIATAAGRGGSRGGGSVPPSPQA